MTFNLEFQIDDIYQKVFDKIDDTCSIEKEFTRVIVSKKNAFRCFISRAYELKSRKYILSAHLVLLNDSSSMSKIQFWDISGSDKEEQILEKIIHDINTFDCSI